MYPSTPELSTKTKNYEMMVELLLEIQEKWDIGVIDLYNDPEMNAVSSSDYERYMDDPRHPTRVGYEEWWTPKFKEHLEKYQSTREVKPCNMKRKEMACL